MFVKIGALVMVLTLATAPAIHATQVTAPTQKYASCEKLLKAYPNGVAQSSRAAKQAKDNGFATPKVYKKIYSENSKRLDRDRDGVICEQQGNAPAPAPAPTIQYLPTGVVLLDFWIESQKYTAKQGLYAFTISQTVRSPQLTAQICTGWKNNKAAMLETLLSASPQLLNDEVTDAWARSQLDMIVTTSCVSKGYSFL